MLIQKYEDWMRPQVISLFDNEYQTGEENFDLVFGNFYEHSFQRERCIRIVALDGDKVAGFQSFFYWPISVGERILESYQSGNSLVHPDYRGRGIFAKLLNFITDENSGFNCELLIGFPVEASYNSFIRNQWKNPLNLHWQVKILQPIRSLFANTPKKLSAHFGTRISLDHPVSNDLISVSQNKLFDDYRFSYQKGEYYRYITKNAGTFFEMKFQIRRKIIKELIIGKIIPGNLSTDSIIRDFAELEREIRRCNAVSVLSVAVNPNIEPLRAALVHCKYRELENKIYFICKGELSGLMEDVKRGWFFRGDIDTW